MSPTIMIIRMPCSRRFSIRICNIRALILLRLERTQSPAPEARKIPEVIHEGYSHS